MIFKKGESQERFPPEIIFCLVGLRFISLVIFAYGFDKANNQVSALDTVLTFTAHFLMFVSYFFYAHSVVKQAWRLGGETRKINYRDEGSKPHIKNLLKTIAIFICLQVIARFML